MEYLDIDLARKDYRDWLGAKVDYEGRYIHLLNTLFGIEFYALINYDEDRGMDGLLLREEWADEVGFDGNLEDFGVANVLEVFVGIAKRIEFQLFGTPYYDEWDYVKIFWDLMKNLEIDQYFGTFSRYDFDAIRQNVSQMLARKYFRHRNRNIFVFHDPPKNLKNLNIWDQMTLYIREKWPN